MLAALGALAAPFVPLRAQRVTAFEAGAGVALALARHTMAGVELGAAYRPRAAGQSRVALAVAAGSEDGRAAMRVQLTAQFLVTPTARRGAGLYGGLGVAFAGRRGAAGGGYLALLIGLESAPGGSAGTRGSGGWYAELGLAGGARVAAGWRGRWFSGRRPG